MAYETRENIISFTVLLRKPCTVAYPSKALVLNLGELESNEPILFSDVISGLDASQLIRLFQLERLLEACAAIMGYYR